MKTTKTLRADGTVRVEREPHIYEEFGPYSFVGDLIAMSNYKAAAALMERPPEPYEAAERLRRNRAEQEERRERDWTRALDAAGIEYRSNPNILLGSGGEFDPPQWLLDRFAPAARAGRALADVIWQCGNGFVLPGGVQSVHIPKITTGSSTSVQSDGGAVSSTDIVTGASESNVVTIAGQADVSQQLYELSPIAEAAIYSDLSKAYNKSLETQLLTGTGPTTGNSFAQLNGLTNISNIPAGNKVDGTSLATIEQQWNAFGQVAANVSNNRSLPPEIVLLAGRRYFWIASSVDNQKRPLSSPGQGPHPTELADAGGAVPYGPIIGLPCYLDGAIPSGSSRDTAYFLRPSDMFLLESTPKFVVSVQASSGTLVVRLSLHRYVAAALDRYPSGVGWLSGLAQPSSF